MEPSTLGQVEPLVYEGEVRPRGCFRNATERFMDVAPGDETRYQTRGFPAQRRPQVADPPDDFPADAWRKMWPVIGALKRAWEYPSLMARFQANPLAYLTSVGGLSVDRIKPQDIEQLLNLAGRPADGPAIDTIGEAPTVTEFALWAGMTQQSATAFGPTSPRPNLDQQAARVVFFLIWRLHKLLPGNIECK